MIRRFILAVLIIATPARADVGFFSPDGVDPAFADQVHFAMINVTTPKHLRQNLEIAQANGIRVHLHLGTVITSIAPVESLSVKYPAADGTIREKSYPPLATNKIRVLLEGEALGRRVAPFIEVMREFPDAIGALFLVDEPYLNGVSKTALERAAIDIRALASAAGLPKVRMGVLFAAAMFNTDFADNVEAAAFRFVDGIDRHRELIAGTDEFVTWNQAIERHRLTTYDVAGNMFTGGGIPAGFDLVSFDFYFSTLLLDELYDDAPSWFAANTAEPSCAQFRGVTMREFRRKLSFFQNGPVTDDAKAHAQDRENLDAIYSCRIRATVGLLREAVAASASPDAEIMLIGESSNNGMLEFNASGEPEQGQPELLVEQRVLDEVRRARKLYEENKDGFAGGLMFFTYADTYDKSISLHVGGASAMPSVMQDIQDAAGRDRD